MNVYNGYGKYRLKLSEYFQMYWYQPNFAAFWATRVLGISWEHLNYPNLNVGSVYWFNLYFHGPTMLHNLSIPLPHEDGFIKVKNT